MFIFFARVCFVFQAKKIHHLFVHVFGKLLHSAKKPLILFGHLLGFALCFFNDFLPIFCIFTDFIHLYVSCKIIIGHAFFYDFHAQKKQSNLPEIMRNCDRHDRVVIIRLPS